MNLLSFQEMPFAQRSDTMFLSTVDSKHDSSTLLPRRDPLAVEDIHGATVPGPKFLGKPPQSYDGLPGTRSMRLHPTVTNKPHTFLNTADIDGAQAQATKHFTTNRVVNPLDPRYSLPSHDEYPTMPTAQLRTTNYLSDIYGTFPRPLYPLAQRQSIAVNDIEGAQVRERWKLRQSAEKQSLDVQDINMEGLFKSQRRVDIMSPRYRYDVPTSEEQKEILSKNSYLMPTTDLGSLEWAIGKIDKNHPRPQKKQLLGDGGVPYFPLTTGDIDGCRAGTVTNDKLKTGRRHYKNINFISDIDGSWPNSKVPLCTMKMLGPGVYPTPRVTNAEAPVTAYTIDFVNPKIHRARADNLTTTDMPISIAATDAKPPSLQSEKLTPTLRSPKLPLPAIGARTGATVSSCSPNARPAAATAATAVPATAAPNRQPPSPAVNAASPADPFIEELQRGQRRTSSIPSAASTPHQLSTRSRISASPKVHISSDLMNAFANQNK